MRLPIFGSFGAARTQAPQPEAKPDANGVLVGDTAVGGRKVHWRRAGPADGFPVVLLHGASFTSVTWEDIGVLQHLGAGGWCAYALDMPGSGRSEGAGLPSDRWLEAALDALGVVRPVVVAPSMSGLYALPLLATHPRRLSGFVAVAPVRIRDYAQRLGCVPIPVLGIWGENDQTVGLDQAKLLMGHLRRGRLVVIPGAGHACHMNGTEQFLRELEVFVEECRDEPEPPSSSGEHRKVG